MDRNGAVDFILQKMRQELPDNLRYHSFEHTLEVMAAAQKIASIEEVHGSDIDILMTAVAFHDSGFILDYQNHEQNSCKLADEYLPRFDFSEEEISTVKQLIMSTKVPQDARSPLAHILCDADLDYLGGDDYDQVSNQLREEIELNGKQLSEKEWIDLQISFLETHHYWTKFGQEQREVAKESRLKALKAKRETLT